MVMSLLLWGVCESNAIHTTNVGYSTKRATGLGLKVDRFNSKIPLSFI